MLHIGTGLFHDGVLPIVMSEGVIIQIAVLETMGFAALDAVHALAALVGFLSAALGFGLTGTSTTHCVKPMVKWVCDDSLPGTAAFTAMGQPVSRVKILVLADRPHTVSPSFTL